MKKSAYTKVVGIHNIQIIKLKKILGEEGCENSSMIISLSVCLSISLSLSRSLHHLYHSTSLSLSLSLSPLVCIEPALASLMVYVSIYNPQILLCARDSRNNIRNMEHNAQHYT